MTDRTTSLPKGYFIMDGAVETHDCDVEDGRFCLYSPDGEPLANLHDREALFPIAWQHYDEGK
jgi:hypothetical protein